MRGPASSRAGGIACAVWRASCRLSPSRGPSVRGRKPSQARRRTSVAGAGEVAAVVAGKLPASRFSLQERRAAPLPLGNDRRGNAVRARRNGDEIEGRIRTPSPTLPTRAREIQAAPHAGGREISETRTPSPTLPTRGREIAEGISSGAGGGGAEAGVAGLALEDRRVKAEHRAPVADRRRADAADRAEFAGIEWTSEALA
jgi:hypothetical protein